MPWDGGAVSISTPRGSIFPLSSPSQLQAHRIQIFNSTLKLHFAMDKIGGLLGGGNKQGGAQQGATGGQEDYGDKGV